jgi:rRNA maturation RNase YbeY
LSIRIFYDSTKYRFKGWRKARKLLDRVIRNRNMNSGDLSIIITTDENLKNINIEFLNHYYYTDVITFNYSKEKQLIGEIYISRERVKENANNYNVSLNDEMLRVMIHGVLHLTGYDDKTNDQKRVMRAMEEIWLAEREG